MIYLWEKPLDYYECEDGDELSRFIGIYNREKCPSAALFHNGEIEGALWKWKKQELEFSFEADRLELLSFDVLISDTYLIIVNQRVRTVLEEFSKKDLQFVPVTVLARNGEVDGYYAVNILSRVSGIDMEQSNIEWGADDEDPYILGFGFRKNRIDKNDIKGGLVYKHDCMGKYNIAKEKHYSFILVSQNLKDALCNLEPPIKDVSFILPEETEW